MKLPACTAVALALLLLSSLLVGGSSSVVSATEFRLMKSAFSGNGYSHGHLLFQPSAGYGTSWYSVHYSGFTATDAKAMCRWLGFSSAVTSSFSSVEYDASYPTYYSMSCSSAATTISNTANMSAFRTYCYATENLVATSPSVYLHCTESGEYTGGGIGAFAGPSGSQYIYVRTSEKRFEWRFGHTTTWYSLCADSMPDATTQQTMCSWLNHKYPSAYAVGTTQVSNDSASFMRDLDCYAPSGGFDSCEATLSSSCSRSAVTLSCTAPAVVDNTDVIVGASVGGSVGLFIIVVVVASVCLAPDESTLMFGGAPSTAETDMRVIENKDQLDGADSQPPVVQVQPAPAPHPMYDDTVPTAFGAAPPPGS